MVAVSQWSRARRAQTRMVLVAKKGKLDSRDDGALWLFADAHWNSLCSGSASSSFSNKLSTIHDFLALLVLAHHLQITRH